LIIPGNVSETTLVVRCSIYDMMMMMKLPILPCAYTVNHYRYFCCILMLHLSEWNVQCTLLQILKYSIFNMQEQLT